MKSSHIQSRERGGAPTPQKKQKTIKVPKNLVKQKFKLNKKFSVYIILIRQLTFLTSHSCNIWQIELKIMQILCFFEKNHKFAIKNHLVSANQRQTFFLSTIVSQIVATNCLKITLPTIVIKNYGNTKKLSSQTMKNQFFISKLINHKI